MVSQECVDKLTAHVSQLVDAKLQLQRFSNECKRLREVTKQEEEAITRIMSELEIGECNTEQLSLRMSCCKRQPTASLKNLLPLIQKVGKTNKQPKPSSTCLPIDYKQPKNEHACNQVTTQGVNAPSLAQAMSELIG